MSDLMVAQRYRLCRVLGRGGMGQVWLAFDELLQRDVAVKAITPPTGQSPEEETELCQSLVVEARAVAQLAHPNVVQIHDLVRWDGRPWIIMEYVASHSLQEVIVANGPLPPAYVASIGVAVLDGLMTVHRAGLLHRDVTPRNILVGRGGRVVLTDFGLAATSGNRPTTDVEIRGSTGYVAPERAYRGHSTVEGDLWSLGATLYAAVEGHSPFARASPAETLAANLDGYPDPPQRAGTLLPVLRGLLVREPTLRLRPDEVRRLLIRASRIEAPDVTPQIRPGAALDDTPTLALATF